MSQPVRGSREFWNFSPAFLGMNALIATVLTLTFHVSGSGSLRYMAEEFLISFVMSVILSWGGFFFERYFDKRMPWIHFPVKRLILEYLSYSSYVFVTSYLVIFLHLYLVRQSITLDNVPWVSMIGFTKSPVITALIIASAIISRSFLLEWRNAAIEAEQLKTTQFAQQYQSLKDQLNPHFLFNSLNVLSNVVYEDQDMAVKFIRQLSQIYRYVLDVQHEELVKLNQELDFAKNYLSLQKIRFEDGLQYKISVAGNLSAMLPPLSLQLLLENAIKHNVASTDDPLHIEITLEDNCLVVKNNLQQKTSLPEESAGVGLSNIRKRYELLSRDQLSVEESDKYFIVKLPLLNLSKA